MPGRISCPTLVGREGEFQRITSLLRDASGTHPLILISGEAGIGKSRLLEAVLLEARGRGNLVLAGSCIPFAGRTLPYGPIIDALRPRAGTGRSPALSTLRRELRAALAVASSGAMAEAGEPIGPAHLFEVIVEALERAADQTDLVLAIEDLHWSDAATRDLLAFLVPSRWSRRVALVATLRTDESTTPLRPLLAELERARQVERVDLEPLGEAGVHDVVAGILGTEPASELVETISRRSGGNPFFIEELVVAARGGEATLPPNLGEILLARLASLPDTVQRMLRYMAVIGERAPEALLAAVTTTDPSVLGRRLRTASEAHVLRSDSAGSYAFRHALVREALYADLLPHERRAMHERVARTLAASIGERLLPAAPRTLALALHWDEAGRPEHALPSLVRAAAVAATSHAYADALQLYRRCLTRWEEHPDAAAAAKVDLGTLCERAARAAFLADDTQAAIDLIRRAIALTDAAADPTRAGTLHRHLCEYLWQHGSEAESIAMTARAFELVPADGSAARAAVVGAWASALSVMSRYRESIEVVEEAVRIGRALGDTDATSWGLAVRALGHCNLDDLVSGMRDLTEAIELARLSTDPDVQAIAFMDAAWAVGAIYGDPARALALASEWEELQRQGGLERSRGMWLAAAAAGMHMRLGRWGEADVILTATLNKSSRGPVRLELLHTAGLLRVWQGRLAEAADLVDEAMVVSRTMIGQQMIGPTYTMAIELAAWRGDPSAGVHLLAEARGRLLAPDDPLWTRHLYAVGLRAHADLAEQLGLRRASGPDIAALRERAVEISGRARYRDLPNLTATMPETEAWAAQGEAELLRIDRSSGEPEAWRAVGDSWSRLGLAAHEAYVRWREAAAWLVRGDRMAAATALEAGHSRAVSVGADAVGWALERLAGRARLRLPTASDGAGSNGDARPLGLTPREAQVLALVARGLTNRQIATALYISEKTAGVHVSNILAKLDVVSRAQAAAVAVQSGFHSS